MRNLLTISTALVTSLLILGCAGTSPKNVERDFGNSVRQMVQSQTLDPVTAANPDPDAPDSGDGQRLNNALDAYRGDVGKREEVQQPLVISVDQ
jgi:hypothetical protein